MPGVSHQCGAVAGFLSDCTWQGLPATLDGSRIEKVEKLFKSMEYIKVLGPIPQSDFRLKSKT